MLANSAPVPYISADALPYPALRNCISTAMGQRHQLFVIAKLGSRYRCLAAVHIQWLYGVGAIRKLHSLLTIFSAPGNAANLMLELSDAQLHAEDESYWSVTPEQELDPENTARFSFIATCLSVGASFDPNTSGRNASLMPFTMAWNQGDNNDGMTVLDIRNSASVRYCYLADERIEVKLPTFRPLSAAEYLEVYCQFEPPSPSSDEKETEAKAELLRKRRLSHEKLMEALQGFKIIDAAAIDETWPGTLKGYSGASSTPLPAGPDSQPSEQPSQHKPLRNAAYLAEAYRAAFKPSLDLTRYPTAPPLTPPVINQILWCRTPYSSRLKMDDWFQDGAIDWSEMRYEDDDSRRNGAAITAFPLGSTQFTAAGITSLG